MKWISVADKLPNDEEAVLMIEEGDECDEGLPVIGWYQCKGCIPG